jgi:hypothetical protein
MIIGLLGKAGSGKDTVADWLVENQNFAKVGLADPLKRICRDVFAFTDEQLWGPSEFRNAPDKRYLQKAREVFDAEDEEMMVVRDYLTPRFALQQLGTEWGRSCYPNVWIDYALRVAEKLLKKPHILKDPSGDIEVVVDYDQKDRVASDGLTTYAIKYANNIGKKPRSGVVIPDCRFRNEFDAIKAAGGKMVKIVRQTAGLSGAAATHASEMEQESIKDSEFDFILANNGESLEELYAYLPKLMGLLQ